MRKWAMPRLVMLLITSVAGLLRSRRDLLLENLALRQQLAALTQKQSLPRLAASDRIFWVLLRRFWSGWKQALLRSYTAAESVIRWHRGADSGSIGNGFLANTLSLEGSPRAKNCGS